MEFKRMMIAKLHRIHQLHVRVSVKQSSEFEHAFRFTPVPFILMARIQCNIVYPYEIFHGLLLLLLLLLQNNSVFHIFSFQLALAIGICK